MATKLLVTVMLKDQILQQHAFERPVVKIGRHRACDVALDNPGVSRVHAELTTEGGCVFVNDKDSSNGLLVNGRRAQREELHDGDVITIGKFTLHVGMPVDRDAPTSDNALSGRDRTIRAPLGGEPKR